MYYQKAIQIIKTEQCKDSESDAYNPQLVGLYELLIDLCTKVREDRLDSIYKKIGNAEKKLRRL